MNPNAPYSVQNGFLLLVCGLALVLVWYQDWQKKNK